MSHIQNIMTTKKQKFEKQKKAGIDKIIAFQKWEKDGIITVALEHMRIEVNFLLWHSFSTKGLVKLCGSLAFYLKTKRAYEGMVTNDDFITIIVNYGNDPNEYGKLGLVETVRFHPQKGFEQI